MALGGAGAFILLPCCPCPPLPLPQERVTTGAQPSCKPTLPQTTSASCLGFSPPPFHQLPTWEEDLGTFTWALGAPGRTLRTVSSQMPGFYTVRGSAKHVTGLSSQRSLNSQMVQRPIPPFVRGGHDGSLIQDTRKGPGRAGIHATVHASIIPAGSLNIP